MQLTAKSPAKVNLFLNIVGKREDGYHLLESLFAPLDLADEITVTAHDKLSCAVDGANIENNIVIKAAKLLQKKSGNNSSAHIHIEKNIPIGGGLGGGSSNAATTLKLLNQLWKLNLSQTELMDLAIEIGADVPFFIESQPAFVKGIGELIEPLTLNKGFHLVLVNPGYEISTPEVFKLGFSEFSNSISSPDKEILNGKNDLYQNALKIKPELAGVIKQIQEQPGCIVSRLSGSGATCFGIFENESSAQNAKKHLKTKHWTYYQHLEL